MPKRTDIAASLEWLPGEDTEHRITVVDKDGEPVPLTGMQLSYHISSTRSGSVLSPFTTKTVGDGIAFDSSAGNTDDIAVITIDAADTSGMAGGVWYKLWRTDVGEVQVAAEGIVSFEDVGL